MFKQHVCLVTCQHHIWIWLLIFFYWNLFLIIWLETIFFNLINFIFLELKCLLRIFEFVIWLWFLRFTLRHLFAELLSLIFGCDGIVFRSMFPIKSTWLRNHAGKSSWWRFARLEMVNSTVPTTNGTCFSKIKLILIVVDLFFATLVSYFVFFFPFQTKVTDNKFRFIWQSLSILNSMFLGLLWHLLLSYFHLFLRLHFRHLLSSFAFQLLFHLNLFAILET